MAIFASLYTGKPVVDGHIFDESVISLLTLVRNLVNFCKARISKTLITLYGLICSARAVYHTSVGYCFIRQRSYQSLEPDGTGVLHTFYI